MVEKDESLFKEDTDSVDKRIKKLEDTLQLERVRFREILFVSIILYVILFDALIFSSMQSFGGPLIIGILEGVGLLLVARAMGLKDISLILHRLITTISPNSDK